MDARIAGLTCLVCLARGSGLVREPMEEASAGDPHLHALLVGCSEYPYLREGLGQEAYEREVRLQGPANDVELVRQTLERVLGLEAAQTTVLAGWGADEATRPTRANILAAFGRLAKTVKPDDRAIVYLAGHGSQQRIQREKWEEEPDGLDEIFLAADARKAKDGWVPNSIRDDELGQAVRSIRDAGADVWLVIDACHSGTMLRGGGFPDGDVRLRGLDPALLGVESATRGGAGAGPTQQGQQGWIGRASSERIAALYGAQSYGRAPEMPAPREAQDARVHGLFSYVLCQELERTGGRGTYRELGERVIAAYQAFPCAITVPCAEGALDRDIRSGAAVSAPSLVCSLRGDVPWLNLGKLAGVEPGVVARVLAIEDGQARPLAQVEVVESDLFEARCRLTDGALRGATSWPAEITSRPLGDWRLSLALVRPGGSIVVLDQAPREVRECLGSAGDRFLLVEPRLADWWIVLAEDGTIWLRPGPREGGFDAFGVAPSQLPTTLEQIQRTRTLRRFSGSALTAGWGGELDVWIERRDERGRGVRLGPEDVLHPGERIRILLHKRSDRIFDVNVFYLDANFGRVPLYPFAGAEPRLAASANEVLVLTRGPDGSEWVPVIDNALGIEHLVVFATPRTPASRQVNLTWLCREDGVQRGGSAGDPFERMVREVWSGTDLRGEPIGASQDAAGTQSLLITVRTDWRGLGPTSWPSSGIADLGPRPSEAAFAAGALPDPWAAGTRAALAASPAARDRRDLLLIGDETVRAVLVDFDGGVAPDADVKELVRSRSFDAELSVLFTPEGRFAFYDREDRGAFDLVLVDREGDQVAEERWARSGERWSSCTEVALPWLSQGYVGGKPEEQVERCQRLVVLQRRP